MRNSLRRHGLTACLTMACAILVAALWWPVDVERERVILPAGPAAAVVAPPPSAVAVPIRSDFVIVAERPLFQPTRRPFVPVVAAVAPPAPPPAPPPPAIKAYTVVGVMMSETRRLAWVKPPSGGVSARIAEGDVIQGWRVKKIGSEGVTFEAGAAEYVLLLQKKTPTAASVGRR